MEYGIEIACWDIPHASRCQREKQPKKTSAHKLNKEEQRSGHVIFYPIQFNCFSYEVKAGGKRVVKKSNEDNGTPEKEGKRPEKPRSLTISSRMQQIGILMGLEKLGHDFPETPVSVRHSRVRPSMEKPHIQRTFFIQQPRKC
uniref:Uncharacterized protein n=1 Tax=Pygocentrus nattereri TaxID=42514 RepID=A0A3B4E1I8_PYGNA